MDNVYVCVSPEWSWIPMWGIVFRVTRSPGWWLAEGKSPDFISCPSSELNFKYSNKWHQTHRYYYDFVILIHRTQGYGWIAYSERTDANKLLQRQTFESDVQPDKQDQLVSTVYKTFPLIYNWYFTTTKQLIGIFVHIVIGVTQVHHPPHGHLSSSFFVVVIIIVILKPIKCVTTHPYIATSYSVDPRPLA